MNFAILLPTFNDGGVISETIDSILQDISQINALCNFTLIVSNNASTDNTNDIINGYMVNHKELSIRLHINAKNVGFNANVIQCAQLALENNVDYAWFMGDDVFTKGAIPAIVNAIQEREECAVIWASFMTLPLSSPLPDIQKASLIRTSLPLINEVGLSCFICNSNVLKTVAFNPLVRGNSYPHTIAANIHNRDGIFQTDTQAYVCMRINQPVFQNPGRSLKIIFDIIVAYTITKEYFDEEEYRRRINGPCVQGALHAYFYYIRWSKGRLGLCLYACHHRPSFAYYSGTLSYAKIIFYALPGPVFWLLKGFLYARREYSPVFWLPKGFLYAKKEYRAERQRITQLRKEKPAIREWA